VGRLQSDVFFSSNHRNRRVNLFQELISSPVVLAETLKETSTYSGMDFYGRGKFLDIDMTRGMKSSFFEEETPESIKASLLGRQVIKLPKDYQPSFRKRPFVEKPYKLPSLINLIELEPENSIAIAIPELHKNNIAVRPPNTPPEMDMASGSIASMMVAAGLQPSEIAEKYQANWSAAKTCRDILQNFFDSHGQTLEG